MILPYPKESETAVYPEYHISSEGVETPRAFRKFTDWSEMGVYNTILSTYEQITLKGRDPCLEGCILTIELFRGGEVAPEVVRNALLLLLALFYPRNPEKSFPSEVIAELPLEQQRKVVHRLRALL